MVSPFIFQNRTKVYFGNGMLFRLHEELARRSRRVLLVYGSGSIKKTESTRSFSMKSNRPAFPAMSCPA